MYVDEIGQKVVQHENTLSCGCSWYAGPLLFHGRYIANCSIAEGLISNFSAEYLLADRGYDTDAIVQKALQAEMTTVITPKKNRNVLREYDKNIYKLRHLVENAFFTSKDGVA